MYSPNWCLRWDGKYYPQQQDQELCQGCTQYKTNNEAEDTNCRRFSEDELTQLLQGSSQCTHSAELTPPLIDHRQQEDRQPKGDHEQRVNYLDGLQSIEVECCQGLGISVDDRIDVLNTHWQYVDKLRRQSRAHTVYNVFAAVRLDKEKVEIRVA